MRFWHEKQNAHAETLPKLFSLFCICRPAPAPEITTMRREGFPSPWSEQLDGGRLAFVTANNPVSPPEKEKKRKRENGKQRHTQGVGKKRGLELSAVRQRSTMKLNLLTAAAGAAAAAAEAREHNDSGRQRRTLFTSPLRVPSSLHRKARSGCARRNCYITLNSSRFLMIFSFPPKWQLALMFTHFDKTPLVQGKQKTNKQKNTQKGRT